RATQLSASPLGLPFVHARGATSVKLAEHPGGGGPLQKWGRGAPSGPGEGIDRDAGIGPPLSCERVRGGAGGPAPLLRRWREPFSEKPKPPRTFKSAASASSAIPAHEKDRAQRPRSVTAPPPTSRRLCPNSCPLRQRDAVREVGSARRRRIGGTRCTRTSDGPRDGLRRPTADCEGPRGIHRA